MVQLSRRLQEKCLGQRWRWPISFAHNYSYRKATIGSTLQARRAGM
jgi:hypothetical protein